MVVDNMVSRLQSVNVMGMEVKPFHLLSSPEKPIHNDGPSGKLIVLPGGVFGLFLSAAGVILIHSQKNQHS